MADRVLLRRGVGASPPAFMQPGELGTSPSDNGLWLGQTSGVAARATTAAGAAPPLTAAALATLFATLPTTLPATPGQPWNNGGVLAFS